MNHIMNDVLNRAGEVPHIPDSVERYAAIFKTYAHAEGTLGTIRGLEKVERLASYVTMKLPYHSGDILRFARNNGDAVIEVTLCNQDQAQLQADIEALEHLLDIEVTTGKVATAVADTR
jgi:hypothetical protein